MAKTVAERLEEARKKRQQGESNEKQKDKSSGNSVADRLKKSRAERTIGFDTLSDDVNALGNTINAMYSGWQDAKTMESNRDSLSTMLNRLSTYTDYMNSYGRDMDDFDSRLKEIQGVYDSFNSAYTGFDDLVKIYADFDSAENYNAHMAEQKKEQERREKERKELLALDTNAYASELDNSKTAVAELQKQRKNLIDAYGMGGDDSTILAKVKDIDNQIAELDVDGKKAYLWKAQNLQKYNGLSGNADWNAQSVNKNHQFGFWDADSTYNYINDIDNARAKTSGKAAMSGRANYNEIYSHMTDDEVASYNYLYNTEGKDSANEYLKYLEYELSERRMGAASSNAKHLANEAPFLADLTSVTGTLMGGVGYLDALGQKTGNSFTESVTGKYAGPINYNSGAMLPSVVTASIRGQRAKNITNDWGVIKIDEKSNPILHKMFDGKGLGDVYQLGMSMVDSAAVAGLTAMGLPGAVGLLGGSAATQGMLDAAQRGATDEQALIMGALSGAAEMLFEKYEIDGFLDKISKGKMGGILTQMLTEGTGEAATSVTNMIADSIIMGANSNWQASINSYMEQNPNMTVEEATKQALLDAIIQTGWDFVGGAVMGGLTTAGGIAVNTAYRGAVNVADRYTAGKKILNADGGAKALEELSKQVYGIATEDSTKADIEKLSKKVTDKKGIVNQMNVGKLYQTVKTAVTEQNITDIAKSLERKGFSPEDAKSIAGALARSANGLQLSEKQTELLKTYANDERVQKTFRDVVANPKSTTGQTRQKVINLSREVITNTVGKSTAATGAKNAQGESISTHSKYDVSVDGKTHLRGQDEVIDSYEIADIKDGKVTLKLANGDVVSADEVSFSSNGEALMVEAFADVGMSADGANAFLQSINSDNGLALAKGIKEVFTYGSIGYPMEAMSSLGFSSALTKTQQEHLYTLAQEKAQKATDEAQGAVDKAFNDAVKYLKDHNIDAGRKHGTVSFEKGAMVAQTKADAQQKKRQTEAIEAAKVLAYITGLDFVFYSSGKGTNGRYDPKTGKVHIDLLAGFDANSLCMYTISHELLHFAKQMSPQKYKLFSQMVLDAFTKSDAFQKRGWTLDDLIQNQIDAAKEDGRKLTWDEAYEEVIADACESLLVDGGFEQLLSKIEARDKGLFNELKQFLQKQLRKLKNFFTAYSNVDPNSYEANIIRSMTDDVQKIVDAFTDMLQDASQKNATIRAAQDAGMELVQALGEYGIGYDADTQSVFASRHSFATNEMLKIGRKNFDVESVAKMVSKVTGRSIEDARKWVQSEVTIANMVLANPEFLDFIPDNRYEAIKKNSDYPQGTVDLSNLCPKREEFTAMFDLLQKTYPDKLFTADDVAEMRKILKSNGITVACGACFVEDRRQLLGEIADTYIGMWKEAIQSGKTLHKVNAEGKKVALYVTGNIAKQYKSIGVKQGDAIMATDKYVPTQYDLTTYEGFKNLQKNHPTIAMGFERYNNSRGQQAARLIEGRAEYDRQILNWSAAKVKSVNNNGGLRIFSFSDFEVVHLLDLVQVIIDCAAKGVKIQGYTKIPAFARLIRNTGIKINRSLIPKGDLGYHMENGKIVLDYDTTEGIDINDENFLDENDNPNVGNILIGINPEQIGAAMLDDFVDYIIPFHSNKAYAILKKLGTGAWFNYKNAQHDKDIATGKSSAKMVNIYTDVIAKYNPTNKVEFVEAFINECKAQGKIPRYEEFLNREYTEDGAYTDADGRAYNYTYREGYHKLIVDFKMFDADGNILPQGNITPNLDESFMKELLNAEIDKKQKYEFPQEVYDAIDKKFGKNSLDNSAAGNENKLTENHNRGELSDNRGIREGASQDTGMSGTDGRRYSEDTGASQETKSWDRQSRLVKNRLVEIVDSYIKSAKSREEVFSLVSFIANISKDEFVIGRRKNAIQKVAEKIYSDAMTLHPLLFDEKWRLLGKANELRSKIIAATKDSDPSKKDIDSDGNQLSNGQQDFFKNTKVVDKNGKLLVMYHGSSSRTMFTVFERRPLINGKNYGEGYYFTEVKNEAYGWGSSFVHTVYVNLNNPYYASTDMEAPVAIVELVKKQLGATYDKLSQDANWWGSKLTREEYIEKNSYRWRDAEIALTHAVDETDIPEDGFLEEVARRKTELLKSLKYDGVIVTTNKLNRNFQEVVAFDSNQIKFITNKNPTKDIDMRYSSRKTDRDYLDAVNRGDMITVQRMVNESAKAAGVIMNENGRKPLSLYRGTPNFGRTVFKSPVIFTTTSPSVSAGYGGNKGYARQRLISERYTQDDGSTETLIKNAKNVLGWELSPYDDEKRNEIHENTGSLSDELSSKVNDVWTGEAIDALPGVDENLGNTIAWVLSLAGSINENIDDFGSYVPLSELESWIDKFDEHLPKFREYLNQHRSELKDTAAWPMFQLVMGYELSDFAIDARYKFLRSFEDDLLVSETGNLVSAETVRDQVETLKDIGSYHLYGLAGNNPLVIDGKGAMWHGIHVEQWGGYFTTDSIVKRAQEEGYTSVRIKNINDVAMNNYSDNVKSDIYAFFDRNQVKSADPVTYDDDGNVIPLSERFNTENDDIRYSSRKQPANGKAIRKVLSGTFFSGGGTVDFALSAILDSQFAVEYEAKISTVYQQNNDTVFMGKDVLDFDPEEWKGKIDYFHASPVCKTFSKAISKDGKAKRIDTGLDMTTAEATAKALRVIQPNAFTLENVPAYVGSDALKLITDVLDGLGYKWDIAKYNSADYGAATSRDRVFIRAVKDGELPAKPKKVSKRTTWYEVTKDLIPGLKEKDAAPSWLLERLKTIGIDVNNLRQPLYVSTDAPGATGVPHAFADSPAPTITANEHMPMLFMPDGRMLEVSPRMLARISGLPDEYKLPPQKGLSKKIIGNGVPVKMTQAVVGSLLNHVTEQDVMFSTRKQGNASNRYILANALENAVKNPTEMEWLSTYKANYAEADALEQQLQDINRQIKELTFSTGNRDKSKLEELKNKQKILTNKLKRIDGKLLKIEASKPLADLLAREKARVEKDVKAKAQKSRQETLMIRNNNIMRHKIQNVVKDIDKLLYRGNKDKNVKLGLQDTISKALQFADVLFAPTPSNAEVLRSASVDMSAAEESSVNKYLAYSDRRDFINAKLKEIRDGVRSAEEYALALDDAQPKIEALEAERAQVQKEIDRISKEIAGVIERARRKVDEASTVSDAINDLAMAYKRLEGTDISYLNGAYDDFVYDHIILLEQEIGNTNIRDMNEKQLLQVYDMFKMMQTAIRDANKLFLNGKKQEKEFLGYNTINEVTLSGKAKESRSDLTAGLRKFGWNTLTIDTVVEILDSSTLKAVVDDIKSAQGVYAKDTADAKEFFKKVAEEVGYWNWDKDKTYTFTATNGGEFSIGIEAMMLLYAYSKRKQAVSHLEGKGFSLRGTKKSTKLGSRTINDNTTYIVMEEKIAEVVGVMEKEYPGAKKYVEKLQGYLSTTMGAKGNEVSEFLYGIDLFVEEYYVPLMTDSQFLDPQDMDKKQGTAGFRRKNSGFTKATVKNATKAITLGNFTEVWSGHVVEMANYHAMVIPLDTMEKLLNFHDGTVSVHGTIEHNWGSEAVQYLRDYINDLNGGIQADKRGGFFEGLIGLQKMSAVALSASVVVQQPTAIFRAMQEIDPKYFLVAPKKNGFEQLKQYSPIAVIKQMGGFDTHTGRGAGSWIVAQEYKGLKGKVKGLLTDKDYRSEAYFWMASKADEVTWAWIWQAILRETKAKHPGLVVGSKEFMEAAGKRADDVLSRTQVYDSTVSKSGLMRSSNGITKMATAFMGEPTVGINNLVYGFVKGKHIGGAKGTKYFLGVVSSVAVAQIAASFAKAFVQAARDDDEDKTYWEKYLDKSTDNLVSDVLLMIPYSIPYVRDLVSMWQGWDIERTDMALLGDLIDAIKAWDSDRKTAEEKITQTAGAIGNLFGIPIKNVYRDIKALVNVIIEMLS